VNVRRAFQTETSRSSVLKRCFHRSTLRQFEKIDFFNRISQKRTADGRRQTADGRRQTER